MKRSILALVVSLAVQLAAGHMREPVETKDRLNSEAMQKMVEDPIATVQKQGLSSGQARFADLLGQHEGRYGANSVQVADLLTAFGVGLYVEGFADDDGTVADASLTYLRDAVARYREVFGPDHPEVAVALHSFADAEISLRGHLTAEAEAALNEALRIRRAALGSDNVETVATERRLAEAKGLDCRSDGKGSAGRALCDAEATGWNQAAPVQLRSESRSRT